ncbi:MAG: nuclear transport factor 2 family protein [Gammaproteobacteria bacterium]|nr:nuclear transport factor 2 family protein [Gammaproteobacteria bacterium]
MQDTDIEHIERACSALSISYARAIDFRDYDAFLELFTDDAVLDTGQPLEGLDAIRASLAGRDDRLRTRHVISNVFVDVLSTDAARGIAYLTLYRHRGDDSLRPGAVPLAGPAAVGHYEDRFARTSEGWRFRSRRLHVAFRDPAQFP